MKRIPTIKTVMTPFPYSVAIDAPLTTATALMREHRIRHLPVKDAQTLSGVITERDISLLLASSASAAQMPTVRTAYKPDPYIVDLNERLDNIAMTMAEKHIDSALVTRSGKLVGIFTCTDACRQLALHLRDPFLPGGGDEAA